MTKIHSALQNKFKNVSDTQLNDDLREWSKLHGVEAPVTCPIYEEYTPEVSQSF